MLRHYLTQATRVLRKQRMYTIINVIGLSVAFGVVTLIALFVQDEFSYDAWHENADRIHRIDAIRYNPDGSIDSRRASHPFILGPSLERDLPGVEEFIRLHDADVVFRTERGMHEAEVLFADAPFFDVFTHTALAGTLDGSLSDLGSIVLTESTARALFGEVDVVGRATEIRFEDSYKTAVVSAVVADPPATTNIPFEAVMPFERTPLAYGWIAARTDTWRASSFPTYLLLEQGADAAAVERQLDPLWAQYNPGVADRGRETGWWTGEGEPSGYGLTSLRELHLRPDVQARVPTSNPLYSWVLIGIGLVILALAVINFTLLSVGQSARRSSEIGVRKALGAGRGAVMAQFGGESLLLAFLGLLGGTILAYALLPAAQSLTGKVLELSVFSDPLLAGVLVVITLLTGILAGWYPAVVVSRHQPTEALRGQLSLSGNNMLTRSLLVTQFAFSVALVAGALAMQAQLSHLQDQDLGFDGSNTIVVQASGVDGHRVANHMRQTVGPRADVLGVSAMSVSINRGYSETAWGTDDGERRAYEYRVGSEIVDVLDMELAAGRTFDAARPADSTDAVVVNEALVREWEWTVQEAVGQELTGFSGGNPTIIGVVRDVNFRSLHVDVEPMVMFMDGDFLSYTLVKASSGSTRTVLEATREAWTAIAPEVPFSYSFLDEDVARAYEQDRRWGQTVRYSALIALLIACMGLFGMAALIVARRTKEIGIRKVLGASVEQVAVLISRDFAWMVAVATLIAVPVAWIGLQRWLDGFAYRITLSPWLFVGAGALVLIAALGTVAYQSIRAALTNPVDALRYE